MSIRHFDSSKDLKEATEIAHQTLLSKNLKVISAAELAPLAGLSVVAAEEALLSLTRDYPANVEVNKDGELLFDFLDLRSPLSQDPAWLVWWRTRRQRVAFLAVLFLGSPLAVLASYSALGIATLFDQSSGLAVWVFGILALFSLPPALAVATASAMVMLSAYGPLLAVAMLAFGVYALVAYDSLTARFGGSLMMFFGGISFFALWVSEMRKIWLGKSRKEIDAFAAFCEEFLLGQRPSWIEDQKRIVELLRHSGGTITATQLMLEFGMNRAEAQRELTRVLLDYGGDIETTEDGAILYHFEAFKGQKRRRLRYTQFDPPAFFTKHKWIQLAIWNTIMASVLSFVFNPNLHIFPGLATLLSAQSQDQILQQGLGAWPALFIGVFLVIRLLSWIKRRAAYRERLPRIELVERLRREQSFVARAESLEIKLLAEFGGSINEEADTPQGEVLFEFPKIQVELDAMASSGA